MDLNDYKQILLNHQFAEEELSDSQKTELINATKLLSNQLQQQHERK